MSQSRWREHCAPIIARVLLEAAGGDEKTIKAALREAYPYGEREHHPYQIWLDEIAVQRGKKLPPDKRGPAMKAKLAAVRADETVMNLFDEVANG